MYSNKFIFFFEILVSILCDNIQSSRWASFTPSPVCHSQSYSNWIFFFRFFFYFAFNVIFFPLWFVCAFSPLIHVRPSDATTEKKNHKRMCPFPYDNSFLFNYLVKLNWAHSTLTGIYFFVQFMNNSYLNI